MIGLNLCPFASQPFQNNAIEYTVITGDSLEHHLHQLADSFARLGTSNGDRSSDSTDIETSLLIFPEAYQKFDDYLELLDLANHLLDDLNYSGTYQIASFHPDYLFADSEKDDAGNFSNRSPYPMLHLLRESSIEAAIATYTANHKNIEQVPIDNINKLQQIGYQEMLNRLRQITG